MHAHCIRWLLAFALLAGLCGARAAEGTGGVAGTIETPKLSLSGATSDKDLVVYLVPKKPQPLPAPKQPVTVAQKQLNFHPHVLTVVKGTKVVFKNEDPVTHNVLCKDACGPIDQDMEGKASLERVYGEAGVNAITCRLHPDMQMFVLVLDTPHFVQVAVQKAEVDGEKRYTAAYEIADVPAGEYTLKVWHKRLAVHSQDVVVEAGKKLQVDAQLTK